MNIALEPDTSDTVVSHRTAKRNKPLELSSVDADTVIMSSRQIDRELSAKSTVGTTSSTRSDNQATTASLIIGSHEPILLDRPTIIGRKPAVPRIAGSIAPRLVMVPSPAREISASHVEVTQVGSSVVVRDLGSANGTALLGVGVSRRLLRQGETAVALDGTIIEIGDEIQIVVRIPEPTKVEIVSEQT
ncbi:MAG: FHA domain-containing protein [Microbacteriaceae bacterium]|nr:FHA domain-containing protein [Cryobacterium sp.]MBX3103432.1 FHA domain-containing protein [Cryobacterium sp.]MCC6376570.1 FHA domain-containing protein [Microbacteriaceae bacterium]